MSPTTVNADVGVCVLIPTKPAPPLAVIKSCVFAANPWKKVIGSCLLRIFSPGVCDEPPVCIMESTVLGDDK